MNIPREAIEKAIEGGWKPIAEMRYAKSLALFAVALDPSFWSSLGKALGWETQFDPDKGFNHQWMHEAKRFYDIILQNGGNGTDAFWKELLAQSHS